MSPTTCLPGTPLFSQLQNFQEHQDRIALVVDEYGELMGLVTLEDILEEIVGEFTTTSPLRATGYYPQATAVIVVEGSTLLRELNRKLGFNFPLDGPKTVNGLILEHLQDIPGAEHEHQDRSAPDRNRADAGPQREIGAHLPGSHAAGAGRKHVSCSKFAARRRGIFTKRHA